MSGSAFHLGGMERVMQTLGRELPGQGLPVEVVIPNRYIVSEVQQWFLDHGVTTMASDELGDLSSGGTRAVVALARFLRQRKVGLVNIHSPGPHVPLKEVLSARLAGSNAVTSIHGYDARTSRFSLRTLTNSAVGSQLNAAVVAMNQVVMLQQEQMGIAPAKLALIYNGVQAPAEAMSRDEARRRLLLPDDAFVITSFGRLVRDKGIDTLVQAINTLPAELLRCCRVLIGGVGPEMAAIKRQVEPQSEDVVSFLGHIKDTSTYYAASDLFILPSRHEPFGLVFLEAAQHGLACIGTRVGGIPEVILDNQTGVLVEPDNPTQLADGILRLSRDAELRKRLGDAARLRARAQFSMESMVQGYATLFRRLLPDRAI